MGSFSTWRKKQNEADRKAYEKEAKAIARTANENRRNGTTLSEERRIVNDLALNRLRSEASRLSGINGRNGKQTEREINLFNKAAKSEEKYRKAAQTVRSTEGRTTSPSFSASNTTSNEQKAKNPFEAQRQGMLKVADARFQAKAAEYQKAVEEQENQRKADLLKYGDVENMSAKEIGDRIKKLESEKQQREVARTQDADVKGYNTVGSGAGAGQISALLNKKGLSQSQLDEMAKLDADADDKLRVYKTALPAATMREAEKNLTPTEIEQIKKAADIIRRDADDGNGHLITTPGELQEVHDNARRKVEYLKRKGVDTDYLIEAYGVQMDNEDAKKAEEDFKDWAGQNAFTGTLASLGTIAMSPITAITDATEDLYHAVRNADTDKPVELNQKRRGLGNLTQAMRQGVSENIENPIWNFVYNSTMSTGDSLMSIATGNLLGGAAAGTKVSQAIMSVGAADQTYNEAIERGIDPINALATAITAGVTEWVTEKYSIDGFKKMALKRPENLKSLVMNIGKQMATEGSEEAASDVLNTIADNAINGKKSEYNQSVKRYMEQGLTQQQAKKAAMMDWLSNTAYDAAAGAFSGALMGAGGQAMSYNQVQNDIERYGGNIKKGGDLKAVIDYAAKFEELGKLVKRADKTANDSKTIGQIAEAVERQVNERIEKAESAEELGELYEELRDEAPDTVGIQIDAAVRKKAESLYEEAEEKERESLESLKGIAEESLVNTSERLGGKIEEANNETEKYEYYDKDTGRTYEVQHTSSPERVEMAKEVSSPSQETEETSNERISEESKAPLRILNHRSATLDASGEKVTIEGIEGTGTKDVRLKIDGRTDEVPLSDVHFENRAVEQIYRVASTMDDAAAATAMISNYDGKQDTQNYALDFDRAYNWGSAMMSYDSLRQKFAFTTPEHIVKMAYYLGQNAGENRFNEAREETQAIKAGERTFKKGTGKAIDERTDEYSKGDVYSQIDQAMAKKLGITVRSVDDIKADEKEVVGTINGYFDAANAEMRFSELAESKLGVRIHESMEFLDKMDPDLYKMTVGAVLKYAMDSNGAKSIYDEIINYRDTYRDVEGEKTFAEATEEYINDAISGAFMSEEGAKDFVNWLGKENFSSSEKKGILKTIAEVINGLIEKIKDALNMGGLTKAQQKIANASLAQQQTIRQIFMQAMDSAIGNYQGTAAGETQSTEKAASVAHSAKAFSIRVSKSGIPYVEVDVDQERFNGLSPKEMKEEALKVIRDKFVGKVIGTKKKAFVNEGTAREYHRPDAIIRDEGILEAKMRASTELDNLLDASEYIGYRIDEEGHQNTKYFVYYMTEFKVGNSFFCGKINAKINNKGVLFYDITKINETSLDPHALRKAKAAYQRDLITDSIPEIDEKVNTPSKSDKEISRSVKVDSEGRSLSKQQIEFFKDSKIRDEEGRLKVMYHGTTEDFTVFDFEKFGGKNGSQDGLGIYLTDNKEIADIYGDRIIESYVNVTRPARYDMKTIKENELVALVKELSMDEAKELVDDGSYDSIEEALPDTWISNYAYTQGMSIEEAFRETAKTIIDTSTNDHDIVEDVMVSCGMDGQEYSGAFYKKLKDVTGIDGYLVKDGSYGDVVIAFDSSQVKDITNENPTQNPDIRCSLSDTKETEDLVKENKDLREMVDTLKQEFEITGGTVPDQKKIKSAARKILKTYSSDFDLDTLTENISNVYSYLHQEGADFDEALRVMSEIARGVLERTQIKDDTMAKQYEDLRKQIRAGVNFTELQREELAHAGGIMSYTHRSGIRSSKQTIDLDEQWAEWSSLYPELFPADTNEGDMPFVLEGVLEAISPQIETPSGETIDQMAYDVAMQIYSEIAKVPVKETFADKKEKEKYEALRQVSEKYEDLVEAYRRNNTAKNEEELQETLEQVRKERAQRIARLTSDIEDLNTAKKYARNPKTLEQYKKEMEKKGAEIARLKAQNETKIAELRQKYQGQRARQTETRRQTETKDKIRKLHEKFRRMIIKPTETMHVPAGLMQSAIEVCETVNLGAKKGTKLFDALFNAERAFAAIKADTENYGIDDFNPQIASDLAKLTDLFHEKGDDWTIYDMTSDELQQVYDCMTEIYESIRLSTKLIREEGERDVRRAGKKVIKELRESKGVKDHWWSRAANKLSTSFLNSQREFRRLSGYNDNGEIMDMWRELNEGQRKQYQIQMEGENFLQKATTAEGMEDLMKEIDSDKALVKVPLRFESSNAPVMVTKGMRLAIILHGKSAANRLHMMEGGMMIPADMSKYKSDKKKAYEKTRKVVGITNAALIQMESELSAKERILLDTFADFFHNWTGSLVNKTSMDLYGFKKARVENYYPISVDKDFVTTDISALKFDKTIEGAGFLKERVRSTNPIMLESVIDTADRSLNSVSMFTGLAIPIRNFNKIMNVTTYKATEGDSEAFGGKGWTVDTSVKKEIKEIWGDRTQKFIDDMIADLQQARRSEATLYDKLRGNYASAVLTANASVIIKQTSAYPMCAAITGWSPALKAMLRGGQNNWILSKADQDLINEYTPIYWERNKGNSTRELAEIREYGTGIAKLAPVRLVKDAIQKVDMAMVGRFWYAAQYYVNSTQKDLAKKFKEDPTNKRLRDLYYTEVAKVFDKCVEETQSTNMTLQNADIMRNTGDVRKIITMFMGQGLQNFGIVYDNLNNLRAKRAQYKNGKIEKEDFTQAKKDLANAVSSQLVSAAVFAGLAIVARALLHRMNPYRDDKEEITGETILAKWGDDFLDNVLGSVPLGSLAYEWASAGISAATGNGWVRPYGQNDIVLQALSDLESSTVNLFKAISKGEGIEKAVNNVAKDGSKLFGVPWENISNLFEGAMNHVKDVTEGEGFLSFSSGRKNPSAKTVTAYLADAIENGYTPAAEQFTEILYDLGKSSKEINSLLQGPLKEKEEIQKAAKTKNAGDMKTYKDTVDAFEKKGYPRDAIVGAIYSIISDMNGKKKETPDPDATKERAIETAGTLYDSLKTNDKDLFKAADLKKAVESGKGISDIVKNLLESRIDKGMKKDEAVKKVISTVKTEMTKAYHEKYKSGSAHERAEIIKKLQRVKVDGIVACDQEYFMKWNKEIEGKKS